MLLEKNRKEIALRTDALTDQHQQLLAINTFSQRPDMKIYGPLIQLAVPLQAGFKSYHNNLFQS